jgi:CBS domain-containing protein
MGCGIKIISQDASCLADDLTSRILRVKEGDLAMICPCCGHDNLPGAETCEQCLHDLMGLDLPGPKAGLQKHLMEVTVAELPLSHPANVSADDPVLTAVELMRLHHVGCALVLGGEKLRGLFTERDALLKLAGTQKNLTETRMREVMISDPVVLRESDTMAVALHKMSIGGFRHLPVVREDMTPVGVVSIRDILRNIFCLC